MNSRCFQLNSRDNVATLLNDADPGKVEVLGGSGTVELCEPIRLGHKVALRKIHPGEPVIKFGVSIGRATVPIQPGSWVHLHNCASFLDGRSSTLDLETGVPNDSTYD